MSVKDNDGICRFLNLYVLMIVFAVAVVDGAVIIYGNNIDICSCKAKHGADTVLFEKQETRSLFHCQSICRREPMCEIFVYDEDNRVCKASSDMLVGDEGDYLWYKCECYKQNYSRIEEDPETTTPQDISTHTTEITTHTTEITTHTTEITTHTTEIHTHTTEITTHTTEITTNTTEAQTTEGFTSVAQTTEAQSAEVHTTETLTTEDPVAAEKRRKEEKRKEIRRRLDEYKKKQGEKQRKKEQMEQIRRKIEQKRKQQYEQTRQKQQHEQYMARKRREWQQQQQRRRQWQLQQQKQWQNQRVKSEPNLAGRGWKPGYCRYYVTVITGFEMMAGTGSYITLHIQGAKGQFSFKLNPGVDGFEMGTTKNFHIKIYVKMYNGRGFEISPYMISYKSWIPNDFKTDTYRTGSEEINFRFRRGKTYYE